MIFRLLSMSHSPLFAILVMLIDTRKQTYLWHVCSHHKKEIPDSGNLFRVSNSIFAFSAANKKYILAQRVFLHESGPVIGFFVFVYFCFCITKLHFSFICLHFSTFSFAGWLSSVQRPPSNKTKPHLYYVQ